MVSNLLVIQEGGTIRNASDVGGARMEGCTWTMNGGLLTGKGYTLQDTTLILNTGSTVANSGNRLISVDSDSVLTVNGGTLGYNQWLVCDGVVNINSGTVTGSHFRGNGTLNINGGEHYYDGSFGGLSHNASQYTVNYNGGTFIGNRSVWRSAGSIAVFGGTEPGTVTFDDWGFDLYDDDWPAGSDDRQDDRRIALDFLSNTLVTLTMNAPRALDFVDEGPNVFNPVYGSNDWPEALWETDRLMFHGRTKTDLGGLVWTDATNYNALGDYFRWSYESNTLTLKSDRPPPGTLIILK